MDKAVAVQNWYLALDVTYLEYVGSRNNTAVPSQSCKRMETSFRRKVILSTLSGRSMASYRSSYRSSNCRGHNSLELYSTPKALLAMILPLLWSICYKYCTLEYERRKCSEKHDSVK